MELIVNGESKTVAAADTVSRALVELGFTGKACAVAVNGDFVPRHQHESYPLEGGESLEVLAPMQGG